MKKILSGRHRRLGAGAAFGALVAGALVMAPPAQAASHVISSNLIDQSETRSTGHNVFGTDGIRVYTEGNTSTDKAAGYFDTHVSLADAGEPSMSWSPRGSTAAPTNIRPSVQLKTDFDNNGSIDGILVGEPVYANGSTLYGDDWWLSNDSKTFVKDAAPSHAGGSGSTNHGTLAQWRTVFPDAQIVQSGWSLGSGVKGDGTINSITVGGDKYYFVQAGAVQDVTLYANDVDTSATRSGGHNDFRPTSGVNVHTDTVALDDPGDAGHYPGYVNKASGFFEVDQALDAVGEPTMEFRTLSGSIPPGLWLNLDIDGDDIADGTLIKEPAYGNDWWLNDTEGALAEFAPIVGGGSGSSHHGSLAEWRAALPADTTVVTSGWSLGAGVTGSYIVDHITLGLTRYGFTGANRAPSAADVEADARTGGTYTIALDATDPDGDPLTYSVDGAEGDVTVDGDEISYEPGSFVGEDSFTYTVTDDRGGEDTADVTVTVTENGAPTAPDVRGHVDVNGTATVTLNGSDPDEDPVTYSLPNSGGVHGEATVDGDQVTFSPDEGYSGPAWFFYTVTDDHGDSTDGFVKFTVKANGAPTAPDVRGTVRDGEDATVTLKSTDPDGDPLTYSLPFGGGAHGSATIEGDEVTFTPTPGDTGAAWFFYDVADDHGATTRGFVKFTVKVNGKPVAPDARGTVRVNETATVTLNGSDPDGDDLSYTLPNSGGVHGEASIEGRVVTFTPDEGYAGPAWFFYTATDDHGASTDGFVKFTVKANGKPVAPDARGTVATNGTATVTLNGSDPDGDDLTYSLPDSGGVHGEATIEGRVVTFTPDEDYAGPAWFFYTVTDDHGGSTNGFVKFTVAKASSATYIALDPTAPTTTSGLTVGVGVVATDGTVTGGDITVYVDGEEVGGATITDDDLTGDHKGRVDFEADNSLSLGWHQIKAVFGGNGQVSGSSRTVTVQVTEGTV